MQPTVWTSGPSLPPSQHQYARQLSRWLRSQIPPTELEALARDYVLPVAPRFRGEAKRLQALRDPEMVISGPSETGKTWAALWYVDHFLRSYPGAQGALVRKIRKTIAPTVLRTYLRIQALHRDPATAYGGNNPEWYDYPNGARLWIGGMDDPGKVLSGERDIIYANQAEELDEADWETLTTRATGRGSVAPYTTVIGDCNPGPADHWIIRRRDSGALTFLESKHEDNPSLYDDAGAITVQGERTMTVLDKLTGVRYLRLRKGLWVGAEGQYFDQLDEALHIRPAPDRALWRHWWLSLDYGWSHPLSAGLFCATESGEVWLVDCHHAAKWTIQQHADALDRLLSEYGLKPSGLRVVAGHDCWASRGGDDPETVADKFGKRGYILERAIISRVAGARAIGERLGNPAAGVAPSLFLSPQTRGVFDTLTRMVHDPRNAEDVLKIDADAEGRGGDDDYDMLRYGVMAGLRPRGAALVDRL